MGCLFSVDQMPIETNTANPAATNGNQTTNNPAKAGDRLSSKSAKEDQIALAFKAKRANVFTQSVDPAARREFKAKNFPKTPQQLNLIRKYTIL